MVHRRASDALGQHFLVDPAAVEKLVAAARLRPGATVLDAGAGRGAVAARLALAVRPGGRVVAIELDAALGATLRARRIPGVEVVEGDALVVPWPAPLDAVVANPPFRILPPLLRRALDLGVPASLVVPRELSQRLTARPGTSQYGRLTVEVAVRAVVERVSDIPAAAFDPAPATPASILAIRPGARGGAADPFVVAALIDAAWRAKDRSLRRSLAAVPDALRLSSERFGAALSALGVADATARGIAPMTYIELARRLGEPARHPQSPGKDAGAGRTRTP